MKNKTILWVFLLALASTAASAQTADGQLSLNTLLPPTPQAAAFARYGEYPVSYATGIPQISIPLYEIKLGAYTLPISISYHASGIKADDVASTVGLGWVLNAGGVISRSVQGAPDLRNRAITTNDTLYYSSKRVQEVIDGEKSTALKLLHQTPSSMYDTESDRYSYNFNGKYGIFAYSHEAGKFVTLNHAPIYIEATGGGKDYSSFYIADSDGMTYWFTEREFTGIANDENWAEVSSWYLTQIGTPYGVITFEYERGSDYHVYSLAETIKAGEYKEREDKNGTKSSYAARPDRSLINYLYRTSLLASIRWNGNEIRFSYAKDRKDMAFTTPENDKCIERLAKMEVIGCDGTVCKTVVFGNDSYFGNYEMNYRMSLRSLSISDEGTYSFVYNQQNLPDYLKREKNEANDIRCKIDYWGYYNGTSTLYFAPESVLQEMLDVYQGRGLNKNILDNAANRMPNFACTKAAVLERITYPTGGYTTFTYEQNKDDEGILVGGLRIKGITNYDNNGGMSQSKTYAYSAARRTQPDPASLMWYKSKHFYRNFGSTTFVTSVSNPIFPLSSSSGCPVWYGKVTETFSDGSYIKYAYKTDVAGTENLNADETAPHPLLFQAAVNDYGVCDPLLENKSFYDPNGSLLREESYDYSDYQLDTLELGTRIVCLVTAGTIDGNRDGITESDLEDKEEEFVPCRSITGYRHRYQMVEKSVTEDGVTTTESYDYDESLRTLAPQAVTVSGSDGVPYRTEYEYPFERLDDPICKRMEEEYLIHDEVVGVVEYGGGQELSRKRVEYQFIDANKDFYPWKVRESLAGAGLRETARYEDYDERGNPRTIVTDNKDATALLWSYNFQYPVAKVEGCTYPQLLQLAGDAVSGLGGKTNTPDIQASLEAIRNIVGGKYPMTAYLYRPLAGPSSVTDSYGHETAYDYHEGSGKLAAVRDASGTLQRFDYNYVKPFNPVQP